MEHEEMPNVPNPQEQTLSPEETPQEQPRERYVPRPKWQLILAWILLGLMVVAVAGYYYWIANPF